MKFCSKGSGILFRLGIKQINIDISYRRFILEVHIFGSMSMYYQGISA